MNENLFAAIQQQQQKRSKNSQLVFREVNMNKLNAQFAENSHTSQFTLQSPCSVKNCCHCWMIIVSWKARRNCYLSIKKTRARIFHISSTATQVDTRRQQEWWTPKKLWQFESRAFSFFFSLHHKLSHWNIKVNKISCVLCKTNERRLRAAIYNSPVFPLHYVKMCFVSVKVKLWEFFLSQRHDKGKNHNKK